MAEVISTPTQVDGALVFSVDHDGRRHAVAVHPGGGLVADVDAGVFYVLAEAVRRHVASRRGDYSSRYFPRSFFDGRFLRLHDPRH